MSGNASGRVVNYDSYYEEPTIIGCQLCGDLGCQACEPEPEPVCDGCLSGCHEDPAHGPCVCSCHGGME